MEQKRTFLTASETKLNLSLITLNNPQKLPKKKVENRIKYSLITL